MGNCCRKQNKNKESSSSTAHIKVAAAMPLVTCATVYSPGWTPEWTPQYPRTPEQHLQVLAASLQRIVDTTSSPTSAIKVAKEIRYTIDDMRKENNKKSSASAISGWTPDYVCLQGLAASLQRKVDTSSSPSSAINVAKELRNTIRDMQELERERAELLGNV